MVLSLATDCDSAQAHALFEAITKLAVEKTARESSGDGKCTLHELALPMGRSADDMRAIVAGEPADYTDDLYRAALRL